MPERTVSYVFKGRFESLTAGLAASGRGVQDLGTKLTALDRNGAKMRQGLDTLGRGAGRVGLVAAAGLGVAIAAAANFEAAMSKVGAVTGATGSSLHALRDAAIAAGAATKFSATEAADGITELSKAGLSAKQILDGGLTGALNLAAVGQIEVGQAAEYTANALNQFKLGGERASHVADLLAGSAGAASGEVGDMANALNYAGVPAANLGVSIEQTAGTIALFAKNGIIGEQAGTSLRGMLSSLTSPSKIAAEQMDELGISVFDAQGKFIGLDGVADQLKNQMSGLTDQERANALGRIFGNEQLQAANVLYREGAAGVQGMTKEVNKQGIAAEQAAKQMDNLKGDLEQLRGSLETALIGAGEGSQGPLRGVAQGLTSLVNGLASVPAPAQKTATALLAITAVTGGSLWFGSKVIGGIAATKGALAALGFQATTTRATLASLGTVGVASAVGISTLLDSLDALDSRARSGRAADARVKSLQDLTDALADSNVGKNAEDLHINLDRLSQDLLENGKNGEYVTKVLADLGDKSHGFDALLDSYKGKIPFLGSSADKAYDANKDLKNIIEASGKVLGSAATSTVTLADGTEFLGTKTEITAAQLKSEQEAMKKLDETATKAGEQFFGLGKDLNNSKVSLGDWIKELENQNKALRNFTINAANAANKGLDQGFIQQLAEQGPEGALRLQQLADASEKEIGRVNAAFRGSGSVLDAFKNEVYGLPLITPKVNPNPAIADVRRVSAVLDQLLHPRVVTVSYKQVGSLPRPPSRPQILDGTPHNQRAAGGMIYGPGTATSDSVPAMLSNGEYVIRAAAVDKYGTSFFDQANRMKLAGGGTPGRLRGDVTAIRNYLTDDLDLRWPKTLKAWEKALDKSKDTLEKERSARDAIVSKMGSTSEAIRSSLRSDLFGQQKSSNVWMSDADRKKAGAGTVRSTLLSDIANAQATKVAIARLKSKGLDGAALDELLSKGSLNEIQGYAGQTRAELADYKKLFNTRAVLSAQAGTAGANAAYGRELALQVAETKRVATYTLQLTRQVSALTKELHSQPGKNGKEIGKAINGAGPRKRP